MLKKVTPISRRAPKRIAVCVTAASSGWTAQLYLASRPLKTLAAKRDKTRSYCRDCYEKRKLALQTIKPG